MYAPSEARKRDSDLLRGSLAAELAGGEGPFGEGGAELLKFHGIYQQDDRDLRRGIDRDYVFMVRASVPGGVLSAEQYLVADALADWVGDGTVRITSRQGLQWHRVRKGSLRPMVWTLNQSLVTTFGACGDVVRNVAACPAGLAPFDAPGWAARLAERFRPASRAYWEIWIDGSPTVSSHPAADEDEPIYGAAYLPRKFKIGIAAPGDNCVDVATHDVGLVPVATAAGELEAFTVLVGGGQGRSHNRPDTYPRLGDPLTTVEPEHVIDVVEAVVTIQRDHGNRDDRKLARLKYLIDAWGLGPFRAAVAERLGHRLPAPRAVSWTSHTDHLGWQRQASGAWFLGVVVESGRIADVGERRLRSALRQVADQFRPEVRLTPQQNLLFVGVADAERAAVDDVLTAHGVASAETLAPLVRDAMACVALPTCALALTDAERSLPAIVGAVHDALGRLEIGGDAVTLRVTGCPNGCARPYTAEIGLVGRRKRIYDIHLGGAADGTRLNALVFELVAEEHITPVLEPILVAWRDRRRPGETFGDFCHRAGSDGLAVLAGREVVAS